MIFKPFGSSMFKHLTWRNSARRYTWNVIIHVRARMIKPLITGVQCSSVLPQLYSVFLLSSVQKKKENSAIKRKDSQFNLANCIFLLFSISSFKCPSGNEKATTISYVIMILVLLPTKINQLFFLIQFFLIDFIKSAHSMIFF